MLGELGVADALGTGVGVTDGVGAAVMVGVGAALAGAFTKAVAAGVGVGLRASAREGHKTEITTQIDTHAFKMQIRICATLLSPLLCNTASSSVAAPRSLQQFDAAARRSGPI